MNILHSEAHWLIMCFSWTSLWQFSLCCDQEHPGKTRLIFFAMRSCCFGVAWGFENLANVCMNLHANELHAMAGLSALTRKCTQTLEKSSQVLSGHLFCPLHFVLYRATHRRDIAKSACPLLCHSAVVSVTDTNSSFLRVNDQAIGLLIFSFATTLETALLN